MFNFFLKKIRSAQKKESDQNAFEEQMPAGMFKGAKFSGKVILPDGKEIDGKNLEL